MDFHDEHKLETYKSLISVGIDALKVLLLLNGGAIVAVLGYLGQVAGRSGFARHVFLPLTLFVVGLVTVALAFLFTYLTQYALFNEAISEDRYSGVPHTKWLGTAIIVAVASLVCFAVGAVVAARALAAA